MFRTRSLLLSVPLALALAVTGCSSSDEESADTSTSTTEAAEETTTTEADTESEDETTEETTTDDGTEVSAEDAADICAALEALSEFDAQSTQIVASGDWAATQTFYVEQTPAVLAAYDQAIATGSAYTDELTQLRAVTAPAADLAASSSDLMDFASKLASSPGLIEAGQAAITLDAFAQETCGVSTGSN